MRWMRWLVLAGILVAFSTHVKGAALWTPPAACTAGPGPSISSTNWNACVRAIADAINAAEPVIQSYPKAALPPAGTPGRLARVTDGVRGIWIDTGTEWKPLFYMANSRDFTSLQAAINSIPDGEVLLIEPGTYHLSSTLTVTSRKQITVKCLGTQAYALAGACRLIWDGAESGVVLLIQDTRDSVFEGFSIENGAGTFGIGIDVNMTAASHVLNTANTFRRISVAPKNDEARIGIRLGVQGVGYSYGNVDLMTFEDCDIYPGVTGTGVTADALATGIQILGQNSKLHRWIRGGITDMKYGVDIQAGSMDFYGGTVGNGNQVDIRLGGLHADPLYVERWYGESSWQFLYAGYSTGQPVHISGLSWHGIPQAPDYRIIYMAGRGPLILENSEFGSGNYEPNSKIYHPRSFTSIGNAFGNGNPYEGGSDQQIISLNNRYVALDGQQRPMPDLVGYPIVARGGGAVGADAGIGKWDLPSTQFFGGPTIRATADALIASVTAKGTTGATTYGYKVVGKTLNGVTAASAEVQVTNGNAVLDGTNYNQIVFYPIIGCNSYDIYRTTGGVAPPKLLGTRMLATLDNTTMDPQGPVFNDTGMAGSAVTPPTVNTTADVSMAGGISVGGGTKVKSHLSATASLDFAAWAGTDCQDLTVAVVGAADGDTVSLGIPNTLASVAGVTWSGWVSAPGVVTVRGCKITAGASANPAAATVRADVWQH